MCVMYVILKCATYNVCIHMNYPDEDTGHLCAPWIPVGSGLYSPISLE